jgi:hypothetical protein
MHLFQNTLSPDQTTHRQVHWTHIQIDGIQPYTKKTNDEAGSRKVVNALSTKDNPLRWSQNKDRNMYGFFNDAFTKHF